MGVCTYVFTCFVTLYEEDLNRLKNKIKKEKGAGAVCLFFTLEMPRPVFWKTPWGSLEMCVVSSLRLIKGATALYL